MGHPYDVGFTTQKTKINLMKKVHAIIVRINEQREEYPVQSEEELTDWLEKHWNDSDRFEIFRFDEQNRVIEETLVVPCINGIVEVPIGSTIKANEH